MASYRPYHPPPPPPPAGQQPLPPVNPYSAAAAAAPQNYGHFPYNPAMNANMYGYPSSYGGYPPNPSQFNANPNPSLPSDEHPPLPPGPAPPPPPGPPPSEGLPPPPPSGPPPSAPPPTTADSIKQRHSVPQKHQKPPSLPPPPKHRAETEEERRIRKQKEYEKHKQDEKRKLALRQSQATVLHKTSHPKGGAPAGGNLTSGPAKQSSVSNVQNRADNNRLKKPTTFMCKMKFRNELPDPTAQLKVLSLNTDKDRYTKYRISSLEKNWKPILIPPPDLGIPLDLLDLTVYNARSERAELAREDEELLRDAEMETPVKNEGIRRKERPTDKGMSWLVKTQYISSLSTESAKKSISEKQAKEMRERKQGNKNVLDNLNNREKQIRAIEESFEAAKLPPAHQSKPGMEAEWVLPLFPYFDRYEDQYVMVNFDGDPTADSEQYNKLDASSRDELESQAIMKSYVVNGSDPSKPEKFLAYMAPSPHELMKDRTEDEEEEMSYSWFREYHWDVVGDDVDDPTTYLVTFDDKAARYLPLGTKLALHKKRAKEGRQDDMEHFPVPSKITVRKNKRKFDNKNNKSVLETGQSSSKHEKVERKRSLDMDRFDDDVSY
ncbi:hypothetical protein LUZ60_011688 [Juncus effusus]|nr:hypothetical protein LUZ60_011688 [Juncus effusus]